MAYIKELKITYERKRVKDDLLNKPIEEENIIIGTDTQYIATLQKQIKKIRDWTNDQDLLKPLIDKKKKS